MNRNRVILVDKHDNEIGVEEKLKAHQDGLLHRAVSAFIFNRNGDMLIHQRAKTKYHSPSLWTNAACTHPQPNEANLKAAKSRLMEEMGFTCELKPHSTILYNAPFDNGLTEHEYDHIFTGVYEGNISPNPKEVMNYQYISLNKLKEEIKTSPHTFTEWFKLIMEHNF